MTVSLTATHCHRNTSGCSDIYRPIASTHQNAWLKYTALKGSAAMTVSLTAIHCHRNMSGCSDIYRPIASTHQNA